MANVEVMTGAPPMTAEENINFDELIGDIMENPELLLSDKFTAEQILEIQKRLNPYAGIAAKKGTNPDFKKVAAVSYTNLREDYLRRLTMTSLVGFIYQMAHEWEVPEKQRKWVAPEKKLTADDTKPYDPSRLVEQLEAALAVAKEAVTALETVKAETVADAESNFTIKPDNEAASTAVALLYAATHMAHVTGTEAGNRLRATADMGMSYDSVREVLMKAPLPPPAGAVEFPQANAKALIEGFLNNYLRFDPSVHVRSGHSEKAVAAAAETIRLGDSDVVVDGADPRRVNLYQLKAAAPKPAAEDKASVDILYSSKRNRDIALAVLADPALATAIESVLAKTDAYTQYLGPVSPDSPAYVAASIVPPQDTFHRWAYYTEVNYEELRTVAHALYPERPDLDWAIALWETFEGKNEVVADAFEKYCQRYSNEVPSAIKALEFGSWSLLADFKENRKNIQFYNKNTEVLKRILDRHADDKRIGADLMRNRVRQAKAKNIAEEGPDAVGLNQYKRTIAGRNQDLASKGVEKVISGEEMLRLEKAKGSIKAAQELLLLDQLTETIRRLSEREELCVAAGRTLTNEEADELKLAREQIKLAKEMVEVPEEAVQVDVFSTDGKGGFTKSHFYTAADKPDNVDITNN